MKRLSAALIFGFLISSFCFAQVQTGNASYNPSRTGFIISHSSLSFNSRVRVINLLNNRSVEAIVMGRIPIDAGRIADISKDAGDALAMDKTGLTLVRLEPLPPRKAESVPVETSTEPPPPVPDKPPSEPPPPAPSQNVTQILPIQTITDVQYIPVPTPEPARPYCAPFLPIIIVLLILITIILAVMLFLFLRRFPLWPWYYPLWIRRHYRYVKKRRKMRS
jgi:hypothetical protein